MVDFAKTRTDVMRKWHASTDLFVPLKLAAAFALHEAHREFNALIPQLEYEDALNLAAAALSRLTPIFVDKSVPDAIPVKLSLTSGKFRHAATMYESVDGERFGSLTVPRDAVPNAVSVIARAGLPVTFAVANRH